ncbi:hypothetical protein HOC54_03630 [Candidatus Peregrinibacteria bacterium]|nr:hypothetical protein [Candidatus Peregrinibacteria bacterium]
MIAKLFDPCGSASWFLLEYDPIEKIAFGYKMLFAMARVCSLTIIQIHIFHLCDSLFYLYLMKSW